MHKLSPHEVVITFDLHGVLFTTDYALFCKLLWQSSNLGKLFFHALYPTIWYRCIRLWLQSSPVEQYIMELTTDWPTLTPCRNILIALANAQKPNVPMIALVHQLKKKGYELHIFSNIGTIILADLHTKFPEILSLFDHTFTTSSQIGYPSKRHEMFFKLYLKSHESLLKKQIVFIDNCPENNRLGKVQKMIVVDAKNPEWVKQQLRLFIKF